MPTLVLAVKPGNAFWALRSIMRERDRGGNFWIDYQMIIFGDIKSGLLSGMKNPGRTRPIVVIFAWREIHWGRTPH